jgi:glycosyltransferase involved in cell wall biosynthesis
METQSAIAWLAQPFGLSKSDSLSMKILWVSPFFLHPTERGAQIRTLGTLRELHKRHEIHFAALNHPRNIEGPARSAEYSSRHIAEEHAAPGRTSPAIVPQLIGSLVDSMPLAISRYSSPNLRRKIDALIAQEKYDSIVCDFLAAAPSFTCVADCVLFEHNVETTIFQRHVEQSRSFAKRSFFRMQAAKMEAFERKICRSVRHVIAVSEVDASRIRQMFGIDKVSSVSTGVDVDYFARPTAAVPAADMVFCGSMDWLPNVDGVEYFLAEILPLIRRKLPGATFTIAGRSPDPRVIKAAQGVEGVSVTGTVSDMRPYLWGSRISVVPLRIGGGTRLKIYESMAAGAPVVSTSVGAEGLRYTNGQDIALADDPAQFADTCIRLLTDDAARSALARRARERAVNEFSWAAVAREFETILEQNRLRG